MVTIKVDGESCQIIRHGKVREISEDYLKVIMSVIESLAKDTDVSRQTVLQFLYDKLSDIYDDDETEIKIL